ncbi:hypothetical protein Lesp02_59780 [Lentzea sp. NBRC 105346]|nr:hypothetical protein Lesp02_59780 [Lentzea sp. NBRC 105346]
MPERSPIPAAVREVPPDRLSQQGETRAGEREVVGTVKALSESVVVEVSDGGVGGADLSKARLVAAPRYVRRSRMWENPLWRR